MWRGGFYWGLPEWPFLERALFFVGLHHLEIRPDTTPQLLDAMYFQLALLF